MDKLHTHVVSESNLTSLQACAYSLKESYDYDDETIRNKFMRKKSGEKSTIRRQARTNLQRSLYSFVWLYMEGYLDRKTVIGLLDAVDNIKDLMRRDPRAGQDARLIDGLSLLLRAAIDGLGDRDA